MKPTPAPLECVHGPAPMPKLDPRPMPALPIARSAPRAGAQRYRMPLWDLFKDPE